MDFIKWLAGGLIGAAIGGALWVAVGYFMEAEVGYIAWGIGLLAGIGVRKAAGTEEGALCGIAGVMSAVGVILAAKYIVVSMFVNAALAQGGSSEMMEMDANEMISAHASDIATEREEKGEKLAWPEGMSSDEAYEQSHFPADVWTEAAKRWNDIPEAEKKLQQEQRAEMLKQFTDVMRESIREEAFKQSFAPYDLLWFGLAAFTAFRVGSGGNDEETSTTKEQPAKSEDDGEPA